MGNGEFSPLDRLDWGRKVPRLGRLLDRLGGSRFKVGRQVCGRRLVVGRVVGPLNAAHPNSLSFFTLVKPQRLGLCSKASG